MPADSVARRIQANRRLVRDGATGDDVARAHQRLDAVLAAYPGIDRAGSGCEENGAEIVVTCRFGPGDLGRSARLAVEFIASRTGASLATTGADTVHCRCAATQFVRFQHFLYYASELQVGRRRKAQLSRVPLPTLLGRALGAFAADYDAMRGEDRSVPQLGAWADVLRLTDTDGLDQRLLGRRAAISKRVTEVLVTRLERQGRLKVEKQAVSGKRGKTSIVRLTPAGEAARASAAALVETVQADWRQRFGNERIDQLSDALTTIVNRLAVELPHHPTGYGAGDPSVTGGDYVPEDPGPPRIPAHGQDWPVVLREPGSDAKDLPLSALLSQTLAAFAIDYERERLGHLQSTSNFLRFVGDDGINLGRAKALGDVSGNGKTLHERHLGVVVEPGRPRDMTRRVYLTPKGRRIRDAYPCLVTEIEDRWHAEHGPAVSTIREVLTDTNVDLDADLPDYPDTTAWIHRLWFD